MKEKQKKMMGSHNEKDWSSTQARIRCRGTDAFVSSNKQQVAWRTDIQHLNSLNFQL